MFKVDRVANRIRALTPRGFGELGFGERNHLQEWIAHHPDVFGERLLIIQKEFADFQDTRERLDLLALDAAGSLVIIENKLDDTGRDMVWQALKYASYCSTLTREQIVSIYQDYLDKNGGGDARQALDAFFETDIEEIRFNQPLSQRLFLVGAHFRKEVTSTALWLAGFGVSVSCYSATLFGDQDDCLFGLTRIIPPATTEEFTIRLAEKTRQDATEDGQEAHRHVLRKRFWRLLLDEINSRTPLFQSISPTRDNWLCATCGVPGAVGYYHFRVTGKYARVEFQISRIGREDAAREVFNRLLRQRGAIDAAAGAPLVWEDEPGRSFFRIMLASDGDIFDEARWPGMITQMCDDMMRLYDAVQPALAAKN